MAVFLRHGYVSASVDTIASEACVSKQTIYNHFHSKEELFKAIVTDMTTGLMEPLAMPPGADAAPARVLKLLARDLLVLTLKPSSLALYRLIVAESARFPELGSALYNAGAGRLIATLGAYFARETRNGRLAVAEPEQAAEQFIGMLGGRVQLRALLGVADTPDDGELDRRADHAVSSFLALYGAAEPRRMAATRTR